MCKDERGTVKTQSTTISSEGDIPHTEKIELPLRTQPVNDTLCRTLITPSKSIIEMNVLVNKYA